MMLHKETEFQDSRIGKIPKDWKAAKLTDVADYINGYAFSPEDWKSEGLPIIRIQNLNDPTAEFNFFDGEVDERYLVKNGDLLFAWSASIGCYLWSRGDAWLNQHIFKVVPKQGIDRQYLYYALFMAIEQLLKRVHGSTMKHFKRGELKTALIPLPFEEEEQRAVVGVLGVVDSAIGLVDEVIRKTERLKKGLMQKLLTEGIGHTEFKDTEIGKMPREWKVRKLGEVLEFCQYGLSLRFGEQGKYPIVKMDDVVNGVVVPDKVKYLDLDAKTFGNFRLEKGDVLFNRTNSFELVGRTGIFLLNGDYVFASYLIRLKPRKGTIDSQYLTYYMTFSNKRLKQLATRAVHQANINATNLQSFKIPVPPYAEQQRIAENLSCMDSKLELEKKQRAKLERIKQGLMDLLLSGKARIKVD